MSEGHMALNSNPDAYLKRWQAVRQRTWWRSCENVQIWITTDQMVKKICSNSTLTSRTSTMITIINRSRQISHVKNKILHQTLLPWHWWQQQHDGDSDVCTLPAYKSELCYSCTAMCEVYGAVCKAITWVWLSALLCCSVIWGICCCFAVLSRVVTVGYFKFAAAN